MYIRTHEGVGRIPTSYSYDAPINELRRYTPLGDVAPQSGSITVAKLAGSLTNLVFWARHPNLQDRALKPNTKEAAEWSRILNADVKPALHSSSTQRKIGQLIFFARHPDVLGHFKEQPKDKQQKLSQEFEHICKNIVQPWLASQLARGAVNSRTIFVVDNDAFRSLPLETRTRAGNEIAGQFAFVNGNAPMSVIFVEPRRFPEAFNFSDAVVSVTDPNTPPNIHVYWALRQQVNNLNRAIGALGNRVRIPAPDRTRLNPERYGIASMNKFVTPAAGGTQVAAPLMASAVRVNELVDYLNKEYIPAEYRDGRSTKKNDIPKDKTAWTVEQKELVGIALGRAMAHEVRHLYVRNPVHAADGLGSDSARLFGKDAVTFSTADKTNIVSSITGLEGQQGTRVVAGSYAAAERSLDFPF
jgi:hypothetical protein